MLVPVGVVVIVFCSWGMGFPSGDFHHSLFAIVFPSSLYYNKQKRMKGLEGFL